ncbi:DinB family protein [Mucilaginibacter yixingensis]|nr:DinB family protein [Mucilaginibacter yixingensis]
MNKLIDTLIKTRQKLIAGIDDLNAEQLNHIPQGFKNNIIWNLAHLVSAQQGLCYLRANAPMRVTAQMREEYAPGTKPERFIGDEEITEIKELLISTLHQLQADLDSNYFAGYTSWVNRHDIELNNVNDVLCYLPFHEGLHADRIAVYKKLITEI